MRLIGIDCQIPSNRIYNEDIIELVRFYSSQKYEGSIKDLEVLTRRFLKLTGSGTRFWRAEKEKPIDLIIKATNRALKMAGIQKEDIGLLIYSGIDRAFIEPSNTSFLCKALQIKNIRSFDIVDACMGWASAVQTANSFLKTDESLEYVMIINSEFPMDKKGTVIPANFTIHKVNELDWKSPSFTLGEATSVCIFKKDLAINCKFEFIEDNDNANLCSIPLLNFEKFLVKDEFSDQTEMQFYSFGTALLEKGLLPSIEVLKSLLNRLDYSPKIVFPHSVSTKIIHEATIASNLNLNIYSTFNELGNIATASIPSAITKALLNGLISKNDKCVAWVASAGMKFAAFELYL